MIHALLALVVLLQDKGPYSVEPSSDAIVVKAGGKEVLRYQLRKPADSTLAVDSACYFHPLTTPSGAVLTDVAPKDHKHHRGIFLAWFEMKGKKDADFWGWGQYAPVKDRVIVNRGVSEPQQSAQGIWMDIENDWKAEGQVLLKEELRAMFSRKDGGNVLDLVYQLKADEDVTLPKRAFSGFCLRTRKDGKATVESPEGEVKLAAPNHMKPESDWPAQPWYGYQITLPDGASLGGAVIDHPMNPPSLWHNAAPIRMINPCIVAPKDVVIKANEPLILRYRVVAWDGATPRELLNSLAKDWAK
jgi:Family of unknown function (DUF6807)